MFELLGANMNHMTHKCLILCFILLANIFQTTELVKAKLCKRSNKFQIRVFNNLPPSPHKLEVHCASGDNDLGYHRVDQYSDFTWSFCDSIFRNTLFFCHLWWYNRDRAFDVFKSKWDSRCYFGVCYWEARGDGIYFSKEYPPSNSTLTKMYDWNIHS